MEEIKFDLGCVGLLTFSLSDYVGYGSRWKGYFWMLQQPQEDTLFTFRNITKPRRLKGHAVFSDMCFRLFISSSEQEERHYRRGLRKAFLRSIWIRQMLISKSANFSIAVTSRSVLCPDAKPRYIAVSQLQAKLPFHWSLCVVAGLWSPPYRFMA